jgi:hypothetical protein
VAEKTKGGREVPGEDTFEGLRDALKETPKLRAMLRKLVN